MIKKFESFVKENHYYDDDITTINVDQAHKVLDSDFESNEDLSSEAALLIATYDEDLLDNIIGYLLDNFRDNPTIKDRFSRFVKIVK